MNKSVILGLMSFSLFLNTDVIARVEINKEMHPEKIIFLMDEALENDDFSYAMQLMARFTIRVAMDAKCCKDLSAGAAMDMLTIRLTIRQMTNPKFAGIRQHVSEKEIKTIVHEELSLVEKELNENNLPNPRWIAQYGMNKYFGDSSEKELFLSMVQCHEEQRKILAAMKESLEKSSNE
jgi:hypothetical protein